MRRVNGYESKIPSKDSRLKGIGDSLVSNLKMDIDDTETNIFGDGVENRGVDDDDDEIGMRNLDSSRRGSEDTTYRRTYGKHLLLKE